MSATAATAATATTTPDLFAGKPRARRPSKPVLPSAPDRSRAQRMEALERANDVRMRRAAFKRDLKAGRAHLTDVIARPPWWLETAKVFGLMLELPKVGRVKANKTLTRMHISPSKTMGGLSERQRHDLAVALRPYNLHPSSVIKRARA